MEKIKILWTGGWDSTYRVLKLRQREVIIEPYYFRFGRRSEEREIETVNYLTRLIIEDNKTRCIIKKLTLYDNSSLPKDSESEEQAFLNLRNITFLGSQYIKLAKLARCISNLELCIHKDDKAHRIITQEAQLKLFSSEAFGEYYQVDGQNTSNRDVVTLFGSFRFPLLELTKLEMKEIAEKEGFADFMDQTWFCHHPVRNRPCGYCNPCIYTIQEGMRYRFDTIALIRYYLLSGLKKILGKR